MGWDGRNLQAVVGLNEQEAQGRAQPWISNALFRGTFYVKAQECTLGEREREDIVPFYTLRVPSITYPRILILVAFPQFFYCLPQVPYSPRRTKPMLHPVPLNRQQIASDSCLRSRARDINRASRSPATSAADWSSSIHHTTLPYDTLQHKSVCCPHTDWILDLGGAAAYTRTRAHSWLSLFFLFEPTDCRSEGCRTASVSKDSVLTRQLCP